MSVFYFFRISLKPSLAKNGEEKEGINLTELLQALDGQREFRGETLQPRE